MIVTNRKQADDISVVMHDEGWWESVLSDEQYLPTKPAVRESSQHTREHSSNSSPSAPTVRPPAQGQTRHGKPVVHTELATALTPEDWANALDLYKQDQIVTLTVTGYNRGGLLVEASRLQGFVPYSHLVDMNCEGEQEHERFLSEYVGRDLRLKIIECVAEEGRIIFSERAARADAGRRTQLFSSLKISDVVLGEVTNVTDFGVFVDLGGVEGLIHISELSWGRVSHPSHIVRLGEKLEVQVLDILPERCRIALSLKRLKINPWETASHRYPINCIVPAVITSVASFGVFARLEEGLEGLVHISQMDEGIVVKNLFAEGQHIDVRVLHIDSQHQRLGLSLKLSGS